MAVSRKFSEILGLGNPMKSNDCLLKSVSIETVQGLVKLFDFGTIVLPVDLEIFCYNKDIIIRCFQDKTIYEL